MNNKNNNNNNLDPQNMADKNKLKLENEFQFSYDLIMYPKVKTDEILVYNEKHGLITLKLGKNNILREFPIKSKFVNLGSSVLLTGGKNKNKIKTKLAECYIITLMENQSPNKYEVIVMPYDSLKEPRERHNLLFLPNKHFVFACSGFFSKTCEYTDIYKGKWEMISPLNKSRGNASMAYVNERYVYILGGFEIKEDKGDYLNDMEYFDINNFEKGWTMINYTNMNNKEYNTSLTSLGIVPISKNTFLICGGNFGIKYKNKVNKIDCNNHENPTIEEISSLGNNTIFNHNMFCKIKESYFNFDIFGHLYCFDCKNKRFEIINQNK